MATNSRFDLTNRTVIVTGGGKGIGKVYAQEFARVGARVVAADIDEPAAKGVAETIAAEGLAALGLGVDIASEDSTKAMAGAALDRFGSIDVLINNASLMSVLPRRSWLEIPVEEWDRVMAVNLRGMFLASRAVFPAMQEQKGGKIVHAWAFKGDLDATRIQSNFFEMEWPPRSGRMQSFQEVDRAEWFDLATAKIKINPAQVPFLEEVYQKFSAE